VYRVGRQLVNVTGVSDAVAWCRGFGVNAVYLNVHEHTVEVTLASQYTVPANNDDFHREDSSL
jgi:hypothetical protein